MTKADKTRLIEITAGLITDVYSLRSTAKAYSVSADDEVKCLVKRIFEKVNDLDADIGGIESLLGFSLTGTQRGIV